MNCAYGIMMNETKIPKDIINNIMDFIITPNKKGLITNYLILNVRNTTPKRFMKMIRFNNNYHLYINNCLNNILYYPRLIDNNTKYMSIKKQINDMNISSLEKLRIIKLTKNISISTQSFKNRDYILNNDEFELTKSDDFKKRLTNIDATYKVFVDKSLDYDETKIMKNNYLRNYNIDAYTQKQFSKVRNELEAYDKINRYLKNVYDDIPYDEYFNTEELYDFYPISYLQQSVYRGTDCVNNFEGFEMLSETNKYYTFQVYYKVNENNRIKISEKVKKDNLYNCLLKNNKIYEEQSENLLNFHNRLSNMECITLDMNKINKKYNLNIDMKYWKKCYGSKYANISSYENIDTLNIMFLSKKYEILNSKVFKKLKKKYNL